MEFWRRCLHKANIQLGIFNTMTLLDKENVSVLILDEKTIHPRTNLDMEMKTSTQLIAWIQFACTGTAGFDEQTEKRNTRGMLKTCPSTQLNMCMTRICNVSEYGNIQSSAYNQTTLK